MALLAVTGLLVCVALASGPTAGAAVAAPGTQRITIGGLLDLSAGWTTLGRASRVTLRLARDDANARFRQLGSRYRVRLVLADAAGDTAVALQQLRRLARLGARVIIGPQSSSEVSRGKDGGEAPRRARRQPGEHGAFTCDRG